ncbi:MAG: DegV family protein [Clostridia bacterium]|nr:DegV family protein [Clostridia bacterium]
MSVRIITDSGSDIIEKLEGLTVLPLKVIFGDMTYLDGVNLSHQEFYEKLVESDTLPTTSQVNPYEFEQGFAEAVQAGDEVVAIILSSRLSATYQSAMNAAMNFPGRVYVVDSLNVAFGQRILVEYALRLRAEGLCAAEIAEKAEKAKHRIHTIALLDTLEYLKRGGRISAAAAFAGGLLSIKPVIAVDDGKVAILGKARGSRQGNNMLMETASKYGVDFDMPLALGYSGLSDKLLQKYITDSHALWEGHEDKLRIVTIGGTIGTHAGPGAIGVAFFEPEK